jgi:hypothetical protein
MIDARELADPEFFSRLGDKVTESRGMLLGVTHRLAGLGLALVLSLSACHLVSLSPCYGDDRDRDEAAEAERLCTAELPHWQLTADGTALVAPKEPVLRWTNPSFGRVYGNTYLWLRDGRPAAAGSLFRYFAPYRAFDGELVALTGTKLVAKRDDIEMWQPTDEWKWYPLPGAPAPAATAPRRLAQMRLLAGEFTVELLDKRNRPKAEDETPRLLPRPLYRYDAERTKTLDGALYAFVLGTDPELLLLLECDTAAAKPEWRFGVARMSAELTRLKRKGKVVWEVPAVQARNPEEAYLYVRLKLPTKEPKP